MTSFDFEPDFRFYLLKGGAPTPLGGTFNSVYFLQSMVTCQAVLATAGTVGQLEATFADPGLRILSDVQPHAMNVVQLYLKNRFGQWGCAWTGYVDTVHHLMDPTQGDMVHITATSPAKLWEIVHLTPTQTRQLAISYAQNTKASSIFAASLGAVGFPTGMALVDPQADGGSGFQTSGIQTAWTTPEEQTWSAVLQALLANTGIEWFFDEQGRSIWRRVGFLTVPPRPRVVGDDDILHADLSEDDTAAVTSIEVRWGTTPLSMTAGTWQAPPGMVSHLRERHVVLYAPWLLNKAAAQNLASVLGLQYSATLLRGTVTIPADPLFTVGSVVQVPALTLDRSQHSYYYLTNVTYNLHWGAEWTMTLGLSYGRARDQQFPYLGTLAYPTATTDGLSSGASAVAQLTRDPDNPAKLTAPWTVAPNNTLPSSQVMADPSLLPAGSRVRVTDSTGHTIGPTPNGDYTVVAGQIGDSSLLQMLNTRTTAAYVTVVQVAQTVSPVVTGPSGTGVSAAQAAQATVPIQDTTGGLGLPTPSALVNLPIAGADITKLSQYFGQPCYVGEPNMRKLTGNTFYPPGPFHTGVDFGIASGAAYQTPVLAAQAGTVSFASVDTTGYGNLVIVTAGDWNIYYAHLDSFAVQKGQSVRAGQKVGAVGYTGLVDPQGPSGAHLHFGIYSTSAAHYLNPLDYLLGLH